MAPPYIIHERKSSKIPFRVILTKCGNYKNINEWKKSGSTFLFIIVKGILSTTISCDFTNVAAILNEATYTWRRPAISLVWKMDHNFPKNIGQNISYCCFSQHKPLYRLVNGQRLKNKKVH